MKAQKAAAAVLTAGFAAYCFSGTVPLCADAAEKQPRTALVLERTAADTDGNFTVTLLLDELPETGLCTLEFAIEYDTAALGDLDVKLLYDTGAQKSGRTCEPQACRNCFSV